MAFVVTGGSVVAASTSPVTVTLPAHSTGDLLIVFGYQRNTSTALSITTATGWTSDTGVQGSTAGTTGVFWKKAASGSETNPVLTGNSGTNLSILGYPVKVTGHDPTTYIGGNRDIQANSAPSTPFDMVTGTTFVPDVANSLIFAWFGTMDNNTPTIQTGGWTSLLDGATGDTSLGGDASLAVYYQVQSGGPTNPGAVTVRQTAVGGDGWFYGFISVNPVSSGDATVTQGALTRTASIPTGTYSGGASVSQGALTITASIPAATPNIPVSISQGALTRTATTYSVVLPNAYVNQGALTRTASIPAGTEAGSALFVQSALTRIATTYTPTPQMSVAISQGALTRAATTYSATPQMSVVISAGTQTYTASTYSVTVTVDSAVDVSINQGVWTATATFSGEMFTRPYGITTTTLTMGMT